LLAKKIFLTKFAMFGQKFNFRLISNFCYQSLIFNQNLLFLAKMSISDHHFLDGDIENFARDRLRNDIRLCKSRGQKYFPVIWPGFSWGNLQKGKDDKFNKVSRRGGAHLWHQVYSFFPEGADGFYGAMFDEVDEGTAWYKILSSRNNPDAVNNINGMFKYFTALKVLTNFGSKGLIFVKI